MIASFLKRTATSLFAGLLFLSIASACLPASRVGAISGADFKAGRIIDDQIFYDGDSLNANQVQSFLNSKLASCDTNGTTSTTYYYKSSTSEVHTFSFSGGVKVTTSRATYGQRYANFWNTHTKDSLGNNRSGNYVQNQSVAPYVCLKNYKQNTPLQTAESGLCGYISAKTNRTSAQIITDVSNACDVSPKVLIVLLHKEQGLVMDSWPWKNQYAHATGFGCPDTHPCDPEFSGFFYQVYNAAYQFKKYRANPTNYGYIAGRSNYIQYNPNASCGGSNVYIQNQATAGLYNYTPYQPNAATLSVGLGQTASCGAYGNKNFWWYFTDWFGSTTVPYVSLDTPRWMETKADIYKKNPGTGTSIDSVIPAGTQIYFSSKITLGGIPYLRTQYDSELGFSKGILLSDLQEIPVTYTGMTQPRWLELSASVKKTNPITGKPSSDTIPMGTKIYFPTKFEVGGKVYLRTQHDTNLGATDGIDIASLKDTSVDYQNFSQPRWMQAKIQTSQVDLKGGNASGPIIAAGAQKYFSYKVTLNGQSFASEALPISGAYTGIPFSSLSEIPLDFSPMVTPRWMQLSVDAQKIDPLTESTNGPLISSGSQIYFTDKIEVGGKAYLRTQHDNKLNEKSAILLSDLVEIATTYTPMVQPRTLIVKNSLQKIDPITGKALDAVIKTGTAISFADKITVGGVGYLRTSHDSGLGLNKVIKLTSLSEK